MGRLLWLCLFVFLAILGSYLSRAFAPWANGDGLTYEATETPFTDRVTAVHGPAAIAGIKPGDLLDEHTMPRHVRGSVAHTSVSDVVIVRNGQRMTMHIVPAAPELSWSENWRFGAGFWSILFAALIAWRGKRWHGAAPLARILALSALGDALARCALPLAPLAIVVHFVGAILFAPFTFYLLVRYFASFGAPVSRARVVVTRIAYAAIVLSTLSGLAHQLIWLTVWVSAQNQALEFELFELFLTSPIVPSFVCGLLAARGAGHADGPRVAWVTASYGIFWIFWLLAGPLGPLWGGAGAIVWQIENAAHLLVPLGLSYAALRRRLFDVGFVVNRAAVFTAVSAIVIGSFVLLEWALGKWFEGTGAATSITLNVILALALGLSMRLVHHRVDSAVDTVFFRKRHENERALRRFANEATLITAREVLIDRTVREILDHSEIVEVQVLMTDALDLNDAAVLAMRAWHEPVRLGRYATAIAGEFAFPMLAHNSFIGIITCGHKRNEEAYAPDDLDALKEVAHGVGLALWALDATQGRGDVMLEILSELRALRALHEHSA